MSETVAVQTTTEVAVENSDQQIKVTEHKFKDVFCSITLVMATVLIGYIVLYGNAANSLHESAMTWAFFIILSILGGYGLGSLTSVLPNFSTMITARK